MNKHISKVISIISICILVSGCAAVKAASNHKKQYTKAKPTIAKRQKNNTSIAIKQSTSSGNISYYFPKDGGQPDKRLIDVMNTAEHTLDIAIYSITKPNIVNSIITAKQRGLTVRLITDAKESQSKFESEELTRLKNAGIPIKINTHTGLMHLKVTIADNQIVTTGSYNYTNDATYKNDEVLVVLNDSVTAKQFESEFARMWNDTANFTKY
ncbi:MULTISPECIES: phospholipase D-like domain-containing protein [Clostridium]|uniref:phospholipase D-like domain-containing protein n=1 Tax=Clostridium TaxID=1485 RepID=UPI0018E26824|nr:MULTISPECIES: phospholipase D-like domain-containing protein [Clostridium]